MNIIIPIGGKGERFKNKGYNISKPLIKILGKPMIGHVFENVSKTNILTDTIVATCDIEIYDYIIRIFNAEHNRPIIIDRNF
jgi:NDP-sugar pyrophosphorylase family protein